MTRKWNRHHLFDKSSAHWEWPLFVSLYKLLNPGRPGHLLSVLTSTSTLTIAYDNECLLTLYEAYTTREREREYHTHAYTTRYSTRCDTYVYLENLCVKTFLSSSSSLACVFVRVKRVSAPFTLFLIYIYTTHHKKRSWIEEKYTRKEAPKTQREELRTHITQFGMLQVKIVWLLQRWLPMLVSKLLNALR